MRVILAMLIFLTNAYADQRPKRITGTIQINNNGFPFVSGGHGWSIPYGDWLITPKEVGSWGSSHGAIGINHDDDIPDPQLGRHREGIEIHKTDHGATAGCIGILSGWDDFKKLVLAMVNENSTWLHVGPSGAAITTDKDWDGTITAKAEKLSDVPEESHHRHPVEHHCKHHHHRR